MVSAAARRRWRWALIDPADSRRVLDLAAVSTVVAASRPPPCRSVLDVCPNVLAAMASAQTVRWLEPNPATRFPDDSGKLSLSCRPPRRRSAEALDWRAVDDFAGRPHPLPEC
jgi:hypothetical protein